MSDHPSESRGGPAPFPFASPPELPAGPVTVVTSDRRASHPDAAAVNFALPGMAASVSAGGSRSGQTGTVFAAAPAPSELDLELGSRLFPQEAAGDSHRPIDLSGIRLEHFEIQERIGIGGMGAVFKAVDQRLHRIVALKVLAPNQSRDPSSVQRFQHEAQAGARLDHENIARVYHIGQDRGLHFIAFEFVTGINLRDLIRTHGRMTPADAVSVTLQIASALRHTEAFNVVHRDIKPSNIIITASGRAKLVDLGLARMQAADGAPDLTVAGTTLGTFDYISPEQARDPRNVDIRSDIYSLGCTLYHMLTGEPPYPEGTVLQKLLDHQGGESPDPAVKNRSVPAALSLIVRKMMSSDPRRRYPTPDDLTHDLLAMAEELGLRATSSDGIVWSSGRSLAGAFWGRHLPWMLTASLLLALVFLLDRYPQFTQRLLETAERGGGSPTQAGTSASRTAPAVRRTLEGNESLAPPPDSLEPPFVTDANSGDRSSRRPSTVERPPRAMDPSSDSRSGVHKPGDGPRLTESPSSRRTSAPSESLPGFAEAALPPSLFDDQGLSLLSTATTGAFTEKDPVGGATGKVGKEHVTQSGSRKPGGSREGAAVTSSGSGGEHGAFPGGLPRDSSAASASERGSASENGAAGLEKPPRPAEGKAAPAIVLVPLNGGEPRAFPTVEAACAQAEDGQIIELRYNGPRPEPEKPWRLSNKKITVRAGKGFRPIIDFVLKDNAASVQAGRMVAISGGALELSHLELRLTIEEQFAVKEGEAVALFALSGSEQLRLHGVAITVTNPASRPATVIEVAPLAGPMMSKMKMMAGGAPLERPRYELRMVESLARGNASLLLVRHTNGGQFELEQTALSLDGAILSLPGGPEPAQAESALKLHLEHVTALLGDGLVRIDSGDGPRELLPVHVDARNNLIASRTPLPLVAMAGSLNVEDLRRLLRWKGEKNFYDRIDSFWSISTRLGTSEPELIDFDGWKRFWAAAPETSEVGAARGGIGWKHRWWEQAARDLIPADLELETDGSSAATAATDGSSVGAELLRIPAISRP